MKSTLILATLLTLVSCGKDTKTRYVGVSSEPGVQAPAPKLECKVYDVSQVGTGSLPNFANLTSLGSISIDSLDNKVSNNITAFKSFVGTPHESLVEAFGLVCEGKLKLSSSGAHTFFLNSDDGSKLFLNGMQIIDNNGNHSQIKKSATLTLLAGEVTVRLEYFNGYGDKALVLSMKEPGSSFEALAKF